MLPDPGEFWRPAEFNRLVGRAERTRSRSIRTDGERARRWLRSTGGSPARIGQAHTFHLIGSARRTAIQIRQVVHAKHCGDFSQPCAGGREEAAEQAAGLELFEPGLPAVGAAARVARGFPPVRPRL